MFIVFFYDHFYTVVTVRRELVAIAGSFHSFFLKMDAFLWVISRQSSLENFSANPIVPEVTHLANHSNCTVQTYLDDIY